MNKVDETRTERDAGEQKAVDPPGANGQRRRLSGPMIATLLLSVAMLAAGAISVARPVSAGGPDQNDQGVGLGECVDPEGDGWGWRGVWPAGESCEVAAGAGGTANDSTVGGLDSGATNSQSSSSAPGPVNTSGVSDRPEPRVTFYDRISDIDPNNHGRLDLIVEHEFEGDSAECGFVGADSPSCFRYAVVASDDLDGELVRKISAGPVTAQSLTTQDLAKLEQTVENARISEKEDDGKGKDKSRSRWGKLLEFLYELCVALCDIEWGAEPSTAQQAAATYAGGDLGGEFNNTPTHHPDVGRAHETSGLTPGGNTGGPASGPSTAQEAANTYSGADIAGEFGDTNGASGVGGSASAADAAAAAVAYAGGDLGGEFGGTAGTGGDDGGGDTGGGDSGGGDSGIGGSDAGDSGYGY